MPVFRNFPDFRKFCQKFLGFRKFYLYKRIGIYTFRGQFWAFQEILTIITINRFWPILKACQLKSFTKYMQPRLVHPKSLKIKHWAWFLLIACFSCSSVKMQTTTLVNFCVIEKHIEVFRGIWSNKTSIKTQIKLIVKIHVFIHVGIGDIRNIELFKYFWWNRLHYDAISQHQSFDKISQF